MNNYQTKLAQINDNFFYMTCSIMVTTTIISYITKNFIITTILGLILGLLIYYLIFKSFTKKRNKKIESKKEELFARECLESLKLKKPDSQREFFINMLNIKYNTQITSSEIFASNDNNSFYFLYNFYDEEISLSYFLEKISILKENKILFLGNNFSNSLLNYIKDKPNIYLINAENTFLLFKSFNYYPIEQEEIKKQKRTFKQIIDSFLTNKNAKAFFKSALALFIFSFFTFYKLYYRLFGFLLFFLGIIAFRKKDSKPALAHINLDNII